MIRVSLSGNVWLEDVPGREFVLSVPPDSDVYYADTQVELEPVTEDDETLRHIFHAGMPFVVCPGGDFDGRVYINAISANSVLVSDDAQRNWRHVTEKDVPRTIDRRRTVWDRLKSDD